MQRKMSIKKKIGFLIKISGMASCAYHLLWQWQLNFKMAYVCSADFQMEI